MNPKRVEPKVVRKLLLGVRAHKVAPGAQSPHLDVIDSPKHSKHHEHEREREFREERLEPTIQNVGCLSSLSEEARKVQRIRKVRMQELRDGVPDGSEHRQAAVLYLALDEERRGADVLPLTVHSFENVCARDIISAVKSCVCVLMRVREQDCTADTRTRSRMRLSELLRS